MNNYSECNPVLNDHQSPSILWQRIDYNSYPNYDENKLEISEKNREKILSRLIFLYGEEQAQETLKEVERLMKVHYAHKPIEMIEQEQNFQLNQCFSHKDMILITYGDLLKSEELKPLATLKKFVDEHPKLKEIFSIIHILPFFPYSSDRGFSIKDFRRVDPKLGEWIDIKNMGKSHRLMFDAVVNHISSQSYVFKELLNGNPLYKDFATVYKSPDELTPEQRKILVRPRTSDILSKYHSIDGPIWIWTTFSADQIDLNFRNPQVLLYMIDTLLLYVRRDADLIRLDAVTYLWDEPGTTGANLKQTHEVIKLFRDIFDIVAPTTVIITETNVPHQENISYFGNGKDEAQMVYNFTLPPLVLYTFYKQDSTVLSHWVKELQYPSDTTTFLNILDTHDGIGLMGVKNILSTSEIDWMIARAREHGAFVSFKTGEGGKEEPYEINTTWFSALNFEDNHENLAMEIKRFVASRSIALALRGVPGIYVHSLVASSNDVEAVMLSKHNRDINRQTLEVQDLVKDLQNPQSKLSQVTEKLWRLLQLRVRYSAFHPNGSQKVLNLSPAVFALVRISPDNQEHIITLTNVTEQEVNIIIPLENINTKQEQWYDLIALRGWISENRQLTVSLQPYQVIWLIPFPEIECSS